jgi:hypothetical protein
MLHTARVFVFLLVHRKPKNTLVQVTLFKEPGSSTKPRAAKRRQTLNKADSSYSSSQDGVNDDGAGAKYHEGVIAAIRHHMNYIGRWNLTSPPSPTPLPCFSTRACVRQKLNCNTPRRPCTAALQNAAQVLAEVATEFMEQQAGDGEGEEAGDGRANSQDRLDMIEGSITAIEEEVLALKQLVVIHRRKIKPPNQREALQRNSKGKKRLTRSRSLGDLQPAQDGVLLLPILEESEGSRTRLSKFKEGSLEESEGSRTRVRKFSEGSLRRPLKTIKPPNVEEEAQGNGEQAESETVTVRPTPNPVMDRALDTLDTFL